MQRPKPDPLRDFDAFDPRSMTPRPARRARHLTPAQKVVLFGGSFSPLQIPGLQLWLDAGLSTLWQNSTRTTPAVADADPVGSWDDLSGNGRHMTQTIATTFPLLKLNQQAGKPWVLFDGINDYLVKTSVSFTDSGMSIFSACKLVSAVGFDTLFSHGDIQPGDVNYRYSGVAVEGNTGRPTFVSAANNLGAPTGPADVTGTFIIREGQLTSADVWRQWIQGTATATNSSAIADISTSKAFVIGNRGSLDLPCNVGLAALLIYNPVLSDSDHARVRAYLNTRWGAF